MRREERIEDYMVFSECELRAGVWKGWTTGCGNKSQDAEGRTMISEFHASAWVWL